jgi:hypothetical protein
MSNPADDPIPYTINPCLDPNTHAREGCEFCTDTLVEIAEWMFDDSLRRLLDGAL